MSMYYYPLKRPFTSILLEPCGIGGFNNLQLWANSAFVGALTLRSGEETQHALDCLFSDDPVLQRTATADGPKLVKFDDECEGAEFLRDDHGDFTTRSDLVEEFGEPTLFDPGPFAS